MEATLDGGKWTIKNPGKVINQDVQKSGGETTVNIEYEDDIKLTLIMHGNGEISLNTNESVVVNTQDRTMEIKKK